MGDFNNNQKPSERLRRQILLDIAKVEVRRKRQARMASLALAISSVFGIFFALRFLLQELSRSGFYEYMSLLLSDPDVVATYWREFTLTLAGTLPLLALTAIVGAVFAFLLSIRVYALSVRSSTITA